MLVVLVGGAGGVGGFPAAAEPAEPRFVEHAEWVRDADLPSLRVYPTPIGRVAAGAVGTVREADIAWQEVRLLAPDADTPGMREQFLCHWQFAEIGQPGKISWNLEPWRPVVDHPTMVNTGCNPGAPEEVF